MLTEPKEIWPNFFIVGAQKAATTSLYHYLKKIPGVYMSPVKEPSYFVLLTTFDQIQEDSLEIRKNILDFSRTQGGILLLAKRAPLIFGMQMHPS